MRARSYRNRPLRSDPARVASSGPGSRATATQGAASVGIVAANDDMSLKRKSAGDGRTGVNDCRRDDRPTNDPMPAASDAA